MLRLIRDISVASGGNATPPSESRQSSIWSKPLLSGREPLSITESLGTQGVVPADLAVAIRFGNSFF
jgi:hypothetical protein